MQSPSSSLAYRALVLIGRPEARSSAMHYRVGGVGALPPISALPLALLLPVVNSATGRSKGRGLGAFHILH